MSRAVFHGVLYGKSKTNHLNDDQELKPSTM